MLSPRCLSKWAPGAISTSDGQTNHQDEIRNSTIRLEPRFDPMQILSYLLRNAVLTLGRTSYLTPNQWYKGVGEA